MSYELLKPYTDKQYADFVCEHQGLTPYENETAFYFLEPNEIVQESEIIINPNYQKEQRIKEIDRLLEVANETYNTVLSTPVQYTNGFYYKPSYAESYAILLAADIFPLTIWDTSELNSVSMSKSDLISLAEFLKNIAEPAFQLRKTTRKQLLEEREGLCD